MAAVAQMPDYVSMFPNVQMNSKYLEGQPYQNNYPGPFNGIGNTEPYIKKEQKAIIDWKTLSQMPLVPQETPKNCTQYTSEFPSIDPLHPLREPKEGFDNFKGSNLTDFKGSNLTDFKDSNLTDFKDPNLTDPSSVTGFGTFVPQFINKELYKCSSSSNPLLDPSSRPVDQFSHNNMVPYFGAKLTQNMRSTGVPQVGDNNSCTVVDKDGYIYTDGFADETPYRDKLATFTGLDESYIHKRETGPMFSPGEQQTGWVFGSPDFRPENDRYTTSIYLRNNESPVEKINVGKGIGLDYSVPAAGGFHQFTRILPNNVSDYKANQLEGRVVAGKWYVNHPESQYLVAPIMKMPKTEWTQARRPTMAGKFYTNAAEAGSSGLTDYTSSVSKGKQARPDTEVSGGFGELENTDSNGPLRVEDFANMSKEQINGLCVSYGPAPIGKIMTSHVKAATQDREAFNSIREMFRTGAAGYNSKGYWECLDKEQDQDRYDISLGPAGGVSPSNGIPRDGYYVNYTDRGEINPYVINAVGTTGSQWNPNNYTDGARVTTKETSEFAYAGNPRSHINSETQNLWSDSPKVTTKETTEYAYQGNAVGTKADRQRYADLPKVTTRETTEYSYSGPLGAAVRAQSDRTAYEGFPVFNKKLNSGKNAIASDKVLSGLSISKDNSMLNTIKSAFTDLYRENFGHREEYTPMEGFVNIKDPPTFAPEKFDLSEDSSDKWSKGGVQKFGLRSAAEVWNWFPGAERANLIADPVGDMSPIGKVSWNGLREPSTYGDGSLLSSNMVPRSVAITNEEQIGVFRPNANKTQFVDYRATDTALVQSLRDNPLSIYVKKDKLNSEIPSFFNFVKPDDYSDYISDSITPLSKADQQNYINGNPQSVVLDLENPMMGITTGIPNRNPKFSGKAYGGSDSGAADTSIYNINWTDDFGSYIEKFHDNCQNKALAFSSPGYDVSMQINDNRFVQFGPRTNLPWGPKKIGTALTQLGGIWNGEYEKNTFNVVDMNQYRQKEQIYNSNMRGSLVAY